MHKCNNKVMLPSLSKIVFCANIKFIPNISVCYARVRSMVLKWLSWALCTDSLHILLHTCMLLRNYSLTPCVE